MSKKRVIKPKFKRKRDKFSSAKAQFDKAGLTDFEAVPVFDNILNKWRILVSAKRPDESVYRALLQEAFDTKAKVVVGCAVMSANFNKDSSG